MATRIYYGRATKDFPEDGIKKGQLHFWWTMNSMMIRSQRPPRSSQITTSNIVGEIREAREVLEDIIDDLMIGGDTQGIDNSVFDVAERVQNISTLCASTSSDIKELFSQASWAKKLSDLSDSAGTLGHLLEELADNIRPDESPPLLLLQEAHALPEWELF